MKKLYLLAITVLMAVTGYGQYYFNTYNNPGKNPGGLNNDPELPSENMPAGWSVILSPSTSPVWSSTRNLPFSFNFNGDSYSQFKVSNSGVLTFDLDPGAAPGFTNSAIPHSSIPDNSIMVWGIEGIQSNDRVIAKTFGSSPNRQYWVMFSSYTKGANTTWTYWSIVLEESTNKIYIVDQRHSGPMTGLTVGIQIDGSAAIGVNEGAANVSTIAGQDATPDDNAYYEFIQGVQPIFDMSVTASTVADYLSLDNGPFNITGSIINFGTETVTSYTLNYSINGGPAFTGNISSVNIPFMGTANFTHPVPWFPTGTGNYSIKTWATNINGAPDQNTDNDAVTKNVFVATSLTQRKVLYEQFTSSTCGPCASSDPTINTFLGNNGVNSPGGKIIAIKYHQNFPAPGTDVAYTTEALARRQFYGVNSIPNVALGGNAYNGHPVTLANSQSIVDNEYNRPAVFELKVTHAEFQGNTVNIKGQYKALADIPAGLRLQIGIMENEINKNIHTSYTGVTTSQVIFKYVMRKMLPNATGTAMPALAANQTVDFNFSHTFASNQIFSSMSDLSVVAFIQNNSTTEVMQAAQRNIISPAQIDLSVKSLSIADTVSMANAPFTFSGEIENLGLTNVTSYTLNYIVDGAAPSSTLVDPANIPASDVETFNHPTGWTPLRGGFYTVKIWANNINGSNDDNPYNDTLTKRIYVTGPFQYDMAVNTLNLPASVSFVDAPFSISGNLLNLGTENVSSYTLNYSINGGATVSAVINENIASPGNASYIHPTEWTPSSGGHYLIRVWATNINGNPDQYQSNDVISKFVLVGGPYFYDMSVTALSLPDSLVISDAPFSIEGDISNLGATAVTSYRLNYSVNGGTHISSQMSSLNIGPSSSSPYTHPTTWNPSEGGGYFIRVWANNINGNQDQDLSNDNVIKYVYVIDPVGVISEKLSNASVKIYPNPFRNMTNVSLGLKEAYKVNIVMLNSLGQVIYSENKGLLSEGDHLIQINPGNLSTGMYFMRISIGGEQIVRKVSVTE